MMIRSGRWRRAAANSSLGVMATCPGISSTASQRTAFWMSDLQLRRLLDYEQPFVGSGMWSRKAFIKVVLPGARSATDDSVFLLADQLHNGIPNMLRHTAGVNQLIRRVPAVELADGQRWPIDRRRRSDNGHAGAVWQPSIEDRILGREVLAQNPALRAQ